MEEFIRAAGYFGLFAMIFAESGVLIGFFLPGDSVLFTAGFLSSQGYLNIWFLIPLMFIAAAAGDSVGYEFGKKVGPRIFKREDSLLFKKKYILDAQHYYEKYGGKTLILARFIPFVRTFAPILAGVGNMKYRKFLSYNLIGAFLWAVGLTLLGYFMGNLIPNVDRYLLPIIAIIVIASIAPPIIKILRNPQARRKIIDLVLFRKN